MPINGTEGNDTLNGTTSADTINGLGGDDILIGGLGGDTLDGGNGTDFASYVNATTSVTANLSNASLNTGEASGDSYSSIEGLIGGIYDDNLTGDSNSNRLYGGGGNDTLNGGGGDDYLDGGAYGDYLNGGAGNDYAVYSNSSAAVTVNLTTGTNTGGDAQNDVIGSDVESVIGSTYDDTLTGNSGSNVLDGGSGGNDTLNGGDGTDYLTGGSYGDYLNGGAGFDYADYANSSAGVTVNLSSSTYQSSAGDAQNDVFTFASGLNTVEGVEGSAFGDTLTGDSQGNVLNGRAGNDVLDGGGNGDILYGGDGNDTMYGSDGNDALYGDKGNDVLFGGNGADTLNDSGDVSGVSLATIMIGGAGADTLAPSTAGSYANYAVYDGKAFANTSDFSSIWQDYFTADQKTAVLAHDPDVGITIDLRNTANSTGDAQGDTYNSNVFAITTSDHSDVLYGTTSGAGPYLMGLGGDDVFYGGTGANSFVGGAGNDAVYAGSGAELILGGAGFDKVSYENSTAGVQVNIGGGAMSGGYAQGDVFNGDPMDSFVGSAYDDVVTLDYQENQNAHLTIDAGSGNDVIEASYVSDTVNGASGNDMITGHWGYDVLTGGSGADTFVYKEWIDATATSAASGERITDFVRGTDKIDLSAVDAAINVSGQQHFSFIGQTAFTSTSVAELRYEKIDDVGTANDYTLIQGIEVAGSGSPFWLQLALNGLHDLSASDFTL